MPIIKRSILRGIFLISISTFFVCCTSSDSYDKKGTNERKKSAKTSVKSSLPTFVKLDPRLTGITFNNQLMENEYFNSFSYDYFYNGGGVAAGDIDNDGLVDIYFTGNMLGNRLYKNMGNWKFKDITDQANVAATNTWCTGTSFVDINADGLLDIYVCRSLKSGNKDWHRNLLYINNGNLTFTESAKKYGLDDVGYSTQASFFDYDLDGDLDVFVANHPIDFQPEDPQIRYRKWLNPSIEESNHLFRNNGDDTFTDVTKQAGLLSYDFTLGIITADMNGDALPDIYLSNDYEHPDRYYMNNGNGTFQERLKKSFRHTSHFSMGIDYSDINNDSLADLVAVDMVAEDNYRQKTMMASMSTENFWRNVKAGYHFQFMRNSIQLNQGNANFAEIGQMAGIAKTDWSWAVLLADFNLDGWKDMFITNGYYRDTRNVDYRNYFEKNYSKVVVSNEMLQKVLPLIPRQKINNYYYENQKNLHFNNKSKEEGINHPSFSNGASYADLDNDGDLDLIVSNLGDPAFIYRNNSTENNSGNFLILKLEGAGKNRNGIGTSITIKHDGNIQTRQHIISRGYQSGVSNQIHFGLGKINKIDQLTVNWPNGKRERLQDVKANQTLILKESNAFETTPQLAKSTNMLFKRPSDHLGVNYKHVENAYDDFEKEVLLPHKMSQLGPKVTVGDVNGDQMDDLFIGGASGSPGELYIQGKNGQFKKKPSGPWVQDFGSEDIGSLFFDSDGDGDMDLYVVSGGNEFEEGNKLYRDRLYLNNGSGTFTKSNGKIPDIAISGSCVTSADYDNDGDLDLFIGGRQTPGKYPFPTSSYILENIDGVFKNMSNEVFPELNDIGMVSTAIWSDFDNDNDPDLIVTGEWMSIRFFENTEGKFKEVTKNLGLDSTTGWWNKIVACDLNTDGLTDYVVGNLGENYKYKASKKVPFRVYANDFDKNGTQDIVLGYSYKGEYYPVRGRECTSEQMPNIKKRFPSYHDFGQAKLIDIYGDDLQHSLHYKAFEFSSVIIQNTGNGFIVQTLPVEAQFSAIQGIVVHDFTNDGIQDIVIAGNFFVSEVETGRADASTGLFLKGKGDFNFSSLLSKDCGFFAPGDVRDLQLFYDARKEPRLIVTNNNSGAQLFTIQN